MLTDFGVSLPDGPEIILGLVGAVGTDLRSVDEAITDRLERLGYSVSRIGVSRLLEAYDRGGALVGSPLDEHIRSHMDLGDQVRKSLGNAALAFATISAIRQARQKHANDVRTPANRLAYIIRSLKRPEEVQALRNVYGPNFFVISAFSTHRQRERDLAGRISESRNQMKTDEFLPIASALIDRDQSDATRESGQNVRDAYPLADVFVDARSRAQLKRDVDRFLLLIFGDAFSTPRRDEYAMAIAYTAALRSAEFGRQVGAVVATPGGDVVSVGTNEVPKSGGGLYWAEDEPNGRDFVTPGYDTNEHRKRLLIGELFDRLSHEWFTPERSASTPEDLYKELAGTRLRDIIEFGRAVHAEMAALLDAARRGVAVGGNYLYCTAFPCHNCARHIVGSGIKRVTYIDPYPKSLAKDLHSDSLVIEGDDESAGLTAFQPFTGVAPARYSEFFIAPRRKDSAGVPTSPPSMGATPRFTTEQAEYVGTTPGYIDQEEVALAYFAERGGDELPA